MPNILVIGASAGGIEPFQEIIRPLLGGPDRWLPRGCK